MTNNKMNMPEPDMHQPDAHKTNRNAPAPIDAPSPQGNSKPLLRDDFLRDLFKEPVNEVDWARDNGFILDEDGHWVPMEMDYTGYPYIHDDDDDEQLWEYIMYGDMNRDDDPNDVRQAQDPNGVICRYDQVSEDELPF